MNREVNETLTSHLGNLGETGRRSRRTAARAELEATPRRYLRAYPKPDATPQANRPSN